MEIEAALDALAEALEIEDEASAARLRTRIDGLRCCTTGDARLVRDADDAAAALWYCSRCETNYDALAI